MGMDIGFIGTGAITTALVTGLCSGNDLNHRIYVSPRNAKRAARLADNFKNVTVACSNQEVLDKAELVILGVVPNLAEEILRPLSFRKEHCVINLMAGRSLPEIASLIGETRKLIHMVPLPFAASRIGPIIIYPYDREVAELVAPLGEIVGVDDIKQLKVMTAITALVSSYQTVLWEVIKWSEREGLSQQDAFKYTTSFFEALSFQARHAEDGNIGKQLADDMTPGGLNEMVLLAIKEQSGFNLWLKSLDAVLARLGS